MFRHRQIGSGATKYALHVVVSTSRQARKPARGTIDRCVNQMVHSDRPDSCRGGGSPMAVLGEAGVFDVSDVDGICWYYQMNGYVVVRDLVSPALLAAIEAECADAQAKVVSGELPERYGSTIYL